MAATPSPQLFVVSGRAIHTTESGYVHAQGHFVTHANDAKAFEYEAALAAALRVMRDPLTEIRSVLIIPTVNGRPDLEAGISAAELHADLEFGELAAALQTVSAGDRDALLAVLDRVQITAMLRAGVRMTGVQTANPPKHATNSLT